VTVREGSPGEEVKLRGGFVKQVAGSERDRELLEPSAVSLT